MAAYCTTVSLAHANELPIPRFCKALLVASLTHATSALCRPSKYPTSTFLPLSSDWVVFLLYIIVVDLGRPCTRPKVTQLWGYVNYSKRRRSQEQIEVVEFGLEQLHKFYKSTKHVESLQQIHNILACCAGCSVQQRVQNKSSFGLISCNWDVVAHQHSRRHDSTQLDLSHVQPNATHATNFRIYELTQRKEHNKMTSLLDIGQSQSP